MAEKNRICITLIKNQSTHAWMVFVGVVIMCVAVIHPLSANDRSESNTHARFATPTAVNENDFSGIQSDLEKLEKNLLQQSGVSTATNKSNAETIAAKAPTTSESKGSEMTMGMGGHKKMKMAKQKGMMKPSYQSAPPAMGEMQMTSMMGKRPANSESTKNLPGFEDAMHLYHLGEHDFFLDHVESINISAEQYTHLLTIKQSWQTRHLAMKKELDALEENLWQQTASGTPDRQLISQTVRHAEKIRGDIRLGLIDAVGKAVSTLSRTQVDSLLTPGMPTVDIME